MSDIDSALKQAFGERLAGYTAPPRRARSRSWRPAIAVGVATATIALGAFAMDVNATAAASGVDCGNLMAKVQFWTSAKSVKAGAGPSAEQVTKWVQDYGCAGSAPKPVGPEQQKPGAPKR